MLGQMAGGIAHEVNNPLMIIDGNVKRINSMLSRPDIDVEETKKYLAVISRTTKRIGEIVKSLLLFSGHGTNRSEVLLNVANEIVETLPFFSEKMKRDDIDLVFAVPEEKFMTYFVSQQLRLVLSSLLNNSFDAIKNQTENKWIQIELRGVDAKIEISITDSGSRLSDEVQEKLFRPFFTTKDVGQGMGLSLSVAKGIVEEHSGQIYFDTNHEHNRFVIQLPKVVF